MLGTNPIRKAEHTDAGTLWVHDVWYTIQGEGPLAGEPAVFVRMGGCNLQCYWCDTEFESSTWYPSVFDLAKKIHTMASAAETRLVVITGGEPLRQSITPLCAMLITSGLFVQIETAGTLVPPGLLTLHERCSDDMVIVCSPKTGKVNKELIDHISCWKYIIKAGETSDDDGLPITSTQVKGKEQRLQRPPADAQNIYVQPLDEHDPEKNRANILATRDVALRFGYRMGVQIHKLAEVE